MKTIFLSFVLVVFTTGLLHAQNNSVSNNKCLHELKSIYTSEKDFIDKTIAEGKSWQLEYTLNALIKQPGDDEYTNSTTHGTATVAKNIRHFKEEDTEIYMDENDIFTINNEESSIFRTASAKEAMEYKLNPFFDVSSESILKEYAFESCKEVFEPSVNANLIEFTIRPRVSGSSIFTMVKIYYDEKSEMVRMSKIWYNLTVSDDIEMVTMFINSRQKVDYKGVTKPIKDEFMTSDGKLKAMYRKYEFKDYTNKPKNM